MRTGDVEDAVEDLWRAAEVTSRSATLFLLGVGFDPRCLVALQQFLATEHRASPVIALVELPAREGTLEGLTRELAENNRAAFELLVRNYEVRRVPYPEVQNHVNAGPRVARHITDAAFLRECAHVVIDISSLPSTIYFPVIAAALRTATDEPRRLRELQAVACENPAIDASIVDLGIRDASLVGGFRHDFDMAAGPQGTTIWAPVVGEQAGAALRAIHGFLDPAETCPVLPFPARNPRRADNLLLEHHVELIDSFQATRGNIVFADERNPFDLYRTLARMQHDYARALAQLAPVRVAVSCHSSKLLSMGALLAAWEFRLPVAAAPASDYDLATDEFSALSQENTVACLWLAGAPYVWCRP